MKGTVPDIWRYINAFIIIIIILLNVNQVQLQCTALQQNN